MQKPITSGIIRLCRRWARVQPQLNVSFMGKVSIGLVICMILSIQFLVAGNGFGQPLKDKLITLELRDVSLRDALNKIEKLSGFKVAYILQQVAKYTNINLEKDTRSVSTTLEIILSSTRLGFRQEDNTILIYPKERVASTDAGVNEYAVPVLKPIHGRVTNEKGEPVSGVSVYVKGNNTIGTTTDDKGIFKLEVPDEATMLVFSSVTTERLELSIAGKQEVNAVLRIKAVQQEEVVVVGYGTQKKSDLTGAVTSLKSSDLTLGGTISNAAQALQGKAAGCW